MPKSFFAIVLGTLAVLAVFILGTFGYLLTKRPPSPPSQRVFAPDNPSISYVPQAVGFPPEGHPMITHVAVVDLEGTGLPGILVCDATANRIGWIRQSPRGVFTEQFIGDPVEGPAHVSVCDVNGDGRPDLLVAAMGQILPNNDKIGKIVVMENLGDWKWKEHTLLSVPGTIMTPIADFEATGRPDVAALVSQDSEQVYGQVHLFRNLGDGRLEDAIAEQA